MTDDLVKRLRDPRYDGQLMMRVSAADRIEELEQALNVLLCEAEDVYVCMADATGIDRHSYPPAFQIARNVLRGDL
jgi:hypothetical protein